MATRTGKGKTGYTPFAPKDIVSEDCLSVDGTLDSKLVGKLAGPPIARLFLSAKALYQVIFSYTCETVTSV